MHIFKNTLAETIFRERYAFHPEETWHEASERGGREVAKGEKDFLRWSSAYRDMISEGLFMPGGRIMYSAGRPVQMMLNCLSGDTQVWTDKGVFNAFELEGKTVNVLNQNGDYVPAEWKCHGEQELYEIVLETGEVFRATAEHEWIVSIPNGDYEKVKTIDLQDRRIPIKSAKSYDINKNSFKSGVQHGIVFGDGSLYMEGKYSRVPQFGDSKPLISEWFDESHYWDSIDAEVATKLPAEFKTKMPNTQSDRSYILGFLAGFIAADGHCCKRGSVTLFQSNKEVLGRVRQLSAICGIATTPIRVFRELNPWTGEKAPLFILTFVKSPILENLLLKENHKSNWKASSKKNKTLTTRVLSVRLNRKEQVFCCEEPISHTFTIGSGYITGNCYVIPSEDSREGWARMVSENIIISGTGGGIGESYNNIRPRGTLIHGTGGIATGAVSIMRIENAALQEIKSGGGRRAARMGVLGIDHPDIEEFLSSKLDLGELNNFNISVWFDKDPEDFFNLVREDKEMELCWSNQVLKKVSAREIWNKIIDNALKNGEPGVINGFLANKMNNIAYCRKLVATNPCSEIFLEPYGVCCLGSVVLPNFIKRNSVARELKDRINWELLHTVVSHGVRFLDDVLDVTYYPIPQIREESLATRRIGLGIMGLHHFLLLLGLKYSSQEGRDMIDKVMTFIKHTTYDASISLAIEKGVFPLYETDGVMESGFIKTLKPSMQSKIRIHGIRNCAGLMVAPTGTTSIVMCTSSGIEPIFAPAYERTYWKGDNRATETVLDPLYEEFILSGKDTSHFESAEDLTAEDHFAMMETVCKHIDQNVSKTINIQQDKYTVESLSELYMKYIPKLKGFTIYPEGSREHTPLKRISEKEAIAAIKKGKVMTEVSDSCKDGTCEI